MIEKNIRNNGEMNIISPLEKRAMRLIELMDHTLKLKREEFAEIVGVTKTTISIWRNPKNNQGLMQSGAKKISEAVSRIGLHCSINWLLHGLGEPPKWAKDTDINILVHNQDRQIEINYFLSTSKLAVVTRLDDNAMQPIYIENDIVGGIWDNSDNIDYRKNYIIELNGQLQVRKLKKTEIQNHYDLFSLYYIENPNYPYEIKNVYLEKVAPIIRVWS